MQSTLINSVIGHDMVFGPRKERCHTHCGMDNATAELSAHFVVRLESAFERAVLALPYECKAPLSLTGRVASN